MGSRYRLLAASGIHLTALVLFFVLLPMVSAVGEPWGCCVPDAGQCFDGSIYLSRDTFRGACTTANGMVLGDGVAATCAAYDQCDLGCCCAGEDVFGSPAINSDENLLRSTRSSCDAKAEGTWSFSVPNDGSTCVAVCGGTTGTNDDETFRVSGIVRNATSGEPLASVGVFISLPTGDLADTTAADGTFTLTDVPEMSTRIFAIHPSCRPGQSPVTLINQDVSGISISLDCALRACTHAVPSITAPTLVRGTAETQFTVAIQDTCHDLVQLEPFRCNGQQEQCIARPPQVTPAVRDTGLMPETTYCYKVRARFSDGSFTESTGSACVTTGEAACMGRAPDDPAQWCGRANDPPQESIMSCTDLNTLQAQPCTGTSVCSDASGTPRCVEPPACSLCNGLGGLFSFLDLEIIDGIFTRSCSEVCVLDRQTAGTPTVVDVYNSCFAYDTCVAYRNPAACEQDLCGVGSDQDPCAWTTVSDELGAGVCASADRPACEQCDDLFGGCSAPLCEGIGPECYFDGAPNGLAQTEGCLSRDAMSCRRYDTQIDCTGGVDASFDIDRDADGAYTGGTNARTTASEDRLEFGSCDWTGERCIKDANELRENDEDDCIENGRFYDDPTCLSDNTAPETVFYLSDPAIYPRVAIRTLPFTVRDDRSPVDVIETYVCIGDAQCVPRDTLGTMALPEDGAATLRWFSVDASGNHESVHSAPIIIKDTHDVALDDVEVTEDR